MCSNRGAPSRDIALRLYGQGLIRQLVVNGQDFNAQSLVEFVSSFQDGTLLKLYGMDVRKKALVAGSWQRSGQAQARVNITEQFYDAALHIFEPNYVETSVATYEILRSVVSDQKERIYEGSCVVIDGRIPPEEEEEGDLPVSCTLRKGAEELRRSFPPSAHLRENSAPYMERNIPSAQDSRSHRRSSVTAKLRHIFAKRRTFPPPRRYGMS
ncbi:hypothetical protein A4X09_0g7143 [Tilletia walkeri]|uniref:Uncharacterized protein n=1 Tax=Tilletia walkeri TaxID=117179 RepID=A0A8X7N3P9_9BASI|nr:hypothetical protein A4X09_0g7143 [Tilletia walkeri]